VIDPGTPSLTVRPSRPDDRDYVFTPSGDQLAATPAYVDLRTRPELFPPVYDQGRMNDVVLKGSKTRMLRPCPACSSSPRRLRSASSPLRRASRS
jgi:hypothetical protein